MGKGLGVKVISEQRHKGDKGESHEDIWRKSNPGRGNSKCKAYEQDVPGEFDTQKGW